MGEVKLGKRIVVVGAGAIGGCVGANMVRVGEDVTFVDGWAEHVQAMRADGLTIDCVDKVSSFKVPVRALHVSDVPQLIKEQPVDIAFICVKSYDTEWATHLMLPYMAPDGVFVSVQNSINEEAIARIVGWGRVIGCAVGGIGGELMEPGRVLRTTPVGNRQRVGLKVGEVHGRITKRLEMVTGLLDNAEPAAPTTNLWGVRWSKLIINAMRNGVSAATGLSGNQRDSNPMTRWFSIRLGSQCIRVGQAMGLTLENPGHDIETLARAGEGDKEALAAMLAQLEHICATRDDSQRPSMGQDIRKGRRTETDYINGLVAARGEEVGVDARLHGQLNELVKKVERGLVKPSPELVAGL
jgi:2-dehydropantoate 2-reductase